MALLVVDDEPSIRLVVRQFLELEGFTVLEAADGAAALAALDDNAVECALIDLQLPGMSGLALVEELRSRHPQLPVIVITGVGGSGRGRALRCGANDYVTKPFELRDLAARLKTLCPGSP